MVKIRLSRIGAKKQPYYRIVVADERTPRGGNFIEQIGYDLRCQSDESVKAKAAAEGHASGSRSDAAALQTYLTEAMANLEDDKLRDATVLSSLAPGGRAQVVKFGRNLGGKAPEALKIGDTLVLQGLSLDRSLFHVSVGGKRRELPRSVAENIFVVLR